MQKVNHSSFTLLLLFSDACDIGTLAVASQSGKRKVIFVFFSGFVDDFFRVVFCKFKFAFNYSPAQHAAVSFFFLSFSSFRAYVRQRRA